jgi:hypothetical protein
MITFLVVLSLVIVGFFPIFIALARMNGPEPVAIPLPSPVEPDGTYRLRYRQKIKVPTRAGNLQVVRVIGNDGNGRLRVRKPGHSRGFWRSLKEAIL